MKSMPANNLDGGICLRRLPRSRLLSIAVAFSALVLVFSSYAFLSGDHRLDRVLLFGGPDPTGARDARGAFGGLAWSLTAVGSPEVVALLAASAAGYILLARRWRDAIFLVAAVAGGAVAGYATKAMFGLIRPHHLAGSTELANTSFPSGHALLATLLAFATVRLILQHSGSRIVHAYLIAVAAGLSVLVGISRVYLGTHWPSDVLAGWAMGCIWVAACHVAIRIAPQPPADTIRSASRTLPANARLARDGARRPES